MWLFNTALPGRRAGQVESVLWDEQWKLVISDSSTARANKSDVLTLLRDDLRRRKRNEERSIWYVALTRAQERLYILHSGCQLDGTSFADTRNIASSKNADAIHFFHELWEHIQNQADQLGATIVCVAAPAEADSQHRDDAL